MRYSPSRHSALLRWVLPVALLAVAACSKDKDIDKPAELTEFQSTLNITRVWDGSVGGDDEPLRLGLGLSVDSGRVYAAGHGGEVAAFELGTGKSIWRTKTRVPLSGGTGAGGDLVVVGSSEGDVIALNTADGAIRWRVKVHGEVLSAPAVSPRAVIVRSVDGRLRGLSHDTGRELWVVDQPVPRLSLRGTSRPVIAGDAAIVGFDNGKVLAVGENDGAMIWEATVAPSRGRTELERLVDIDSAVKVAGDDVYAVGFQGRVAMLGRETGQIWWSHEASSYRGLGIDDESLYLSTASGEVVSMRRRTGAEVWRQNALLHRGLSAPVALENAIAVADFQGYVHWLDKATGELAARTSAGGSRISNPPVVADDMLLVINDEGRISAFRAEPNTRRASLEKKAAEPVAPVPAVEPAAAPPVESSPVPAEEAATPLPAESPRTGDQPPPGQ